MEEGRREEKARGKEVDEGWEKITYWPCHHQASWREVYRTDPWSSSNSTISVASDSQTIPGFSEEEIRNDQQKNARLSKEEMGFDLKLVQVILRANSR